MISRSAIEQKGMAMFRNKDGERGTLPDCHEFRIAEIFPTQPDDDDGRARHVFRGMALDKANGRRAEAPLAYGSSIGHDLF